MGGIVSVVRRQCEISSLGISSHMLKESYAFLGLLICLYSECCSMNELYDFRILQCRTEGTWLIPELQDVMSVACCDSLTLMTWTFTVSTLGHYLW